MKSKRIKQAGITALALLLLTQNICTVSAASSSEKDEVIYVTLDEDGNNAQIYVVNGFDMNAAGQVLDYGDYLDVKNLSTKEAISVKDSTVEFQAKKGKTYYQGTLQEKELPWDVSVTYSLDGRVISGAELAGKSGNLEMTLKLTQNSEADSIYRKHFALQATVVLEGNHASEIVASGATAANIGEDKQLTYIVLPDTEKEFVISAKVTDFEMDGIQINGIPLAIDVDAPDTKEMKDKMLELKDGAVKLNDGTQTLKNGTLELTKGTDAFSDGTTSLSKGIGQYLNGVGTLADGITSLKIGSTDLVNGSSKFKEGVQTISAQSQALNTGSAQMGQGLSDLADAVNDTNGSTLTDMQQKAQELAGGSDSYLTALGQVIDSQCAQRDTMIANGLADSPELQVLNENINTLYQLQNQYSQIHEGVNTLTNAVSQNSNLLSRFKDGVNALNQNYSELQTGISAYTNGVDSLASAYEQINNGIFSLDTGVRDLNVGAQELKSRSGEPLSGITDLKDASQQLAIGSKELSDGAAKLHDGTSELRAKTNTIDTDMDEEIQKMLDEYRSSDFSYESFTDERNTNVKSVQFVICTEKIEKQKVLSTEQKEEVKEESFWDRLISLFQ